MLKPVDIPVPRTSSDDLRVGHWIQEPSGADPTVVILGFPSDEGVRRNGGRVGAADAPDVIRRALYRLTPDPRNQEAFCAVLAATQDIGNLVLSGDLERDQALLGRTVAGLLSAGVIPVILGGGHETAYGHFLSYVENSTPVSILNVDAHADVRPLKEGRAHSGSPFYQALEHESGLCRNYTAWGLAPWSVAGAHISFLEKHKCTYRWVDEINPELTGAYFSALEDQTLLTLDMDVLEQQAAPGVSAPAVRGLPLQIVLEIAYLAGKSPAVSSLDLVEVNPSFDIDHHTARTAGLIIWHFFKGLAERIC